jgi:hypothetical protein
MGCLRLRFTFIVEGKKAFSGRCAYWSEAADEGKEEKLHYIITEEI